MILTPNERTKLLLEALDDWLMRDFDGMPLEALRAGLECRDVLLTQLFEADEDCDCGIAYCMHWTPDDG